MTNEIMQSKLKSYINLFPFWMKQDEDFLTFIKSIFELGLQVQKVKDDIIESFRFKNLYKCKTSLNDIANFYNIDSVYFEEMESLNDINEEGGIISYTRTEKKKKLNYVIQDRNILRRIKVKSILNNFSGSLRDLQYTLERVFAIEEEEEEEEDFTISAKLGKIDTDNGWKSLLELNLSIEGFPGVDKLNSSSYFIIAVTDLINSIEKEKGLSISDKEVLETSIKNIIAKRYGDISTEHSYKGRFSKLITYILEDIFKEDLNEYTDEITSVSNDLFSYFFQFVELYLNSYFNFNLMGVVIIYKLAEKPLWFTWGASRWSKYETDENGKLILDENGKPIPIYTEYWKEFKN